MSLRTLCDIPRRLLADHAKPDQFLYKEGGAWRPIATAEFCERIRDLAAGLRAMGVRPSDRVAILSENRPEWTACDYAILSAGAATVPIYPTLLPDQIAFILRDSGAKLAFASTPDQMQKLHAVRGALPDLKEVAWFEPPSGGDARSGGVRSWSDVAALGADRLQAGGGPAAMGLDLAVPEDLASIIYTSGTTGRPKGVMLTHGNFAHNVVACCEAIPFASADICLSILPLSHVYERMVEYCYLHRGATIAYAESIDTVAADLRAVRPTIACAVPRLFEKMYRRIQDRGEALPAARRAIFRWALKVARACGARQRLPGGPGILLAAQRAVADALVYSEVRASLGGRMRFFISGSAPLSREIAEPLYGMGIRILEGYGLTETSPVITLNRLDDLCFGSVGRPIAGVEVRMAGDGEIETRGPSVMRGYFNDEAASREAMRDGWFATGDIGRFDAHGCLIITDRKKEVLKTSGGKMVAPQPIENRLRADRFIGQAVVIGDRRHFISALIVPNFEMMRSYAALKGIGETGMASLLRHPRIINLLERRIAAINKDLPRYERVRAFRLLDKDFTVEAGEITPTLKPRRRVIEERYRGLIDAMYAAPPPGAGAPNAAPPGREGTGS